MFEIGIVSDEIALDIHEAVRIGKELGFKKYEIRCVGSYEKRIPFIDDDDLNFIRNQVKSGEMELTAFSPGSFKIKPSDTKQLDHHLNSILPKTFELAAELGVEKIISFSFIRDETDEDKVVEILRQAGELAAKYGLVFAVENEPGFYCDTSENTARILEKINLKNVGANWDPGNANSAGEIAYPNGYETLKPYIVNLHIKDTLYGPKLKNELIFDGGINWVGQLNAVYKDKILPYVTLETHLVPLEEMTREDLRRIYMIIDIIKKINS